MRVVKNKFPFIIPGHRNMELYARLSIFVPFNDSQVPQQLTNKRF